MNHGALPRAVVEVVDLIYEAALSAGCWNAVLAAIGALVRGDNGYLSHVNLAERALDCTALDALAWDPEPLDRYRQGMPTDPFMRALRLAPARVLRCAVVVPPEAKASLPQYREVFPALGIAHSLGVSLRHEDGVTTFLGVTRVARRSAFSERDCALVQHIVPHLQRAMLLDRERQASEAQARAAIAMVDGLPLALMVITRARRVVIANRVAQQLLGAGQGVTISHGVLAFRSPTVKARVDDAITRLCGCAVSARSSRSLEVITLSEPGTGPEWIALLSNVPASPMADQASEQAVLLVIHDMGRPLGVEAAALLQQLYGLPPALARLAASLAAGRTLAEAARQHGITAESGRIYLKRIFERIGVSRQSDLVRRLATLSTTVPVSGEGMGRTTAPRASDRSERD
jgi:DNA-binding CsgD family transcriptional regulator/PAS domain-containing protein